MLFVLRDAAQKNARSEQTRDQHDEHKGDTEPLREFWHLHLDQENKSDRDAHNQQHHELRPGLQPVHGAYQKKHRYYRRDQYQQQQSIRHYDLTPGFKVISPLV
jgi:hypothetical protein